MDTKMIGSKIARARKEKNMSQAQLAQLLFISPQAVGKWERGESTPDITTFGRLGEILGVDLNYFSENFKSPDGETDPRKANDGIEAESPLLTNFNGSNLSKSDFAGITAHKMKFNGSALSGSDFSGADLGGSSFSSSDAHEANFDDANLTDCILFATNLSNASFNKTILVRTVFKASDLTRTTFSDTRLIHAKLTRCDLRKTIFRSCVFDGVDFDSSDMRAQNLDGQTFTNVKFHNTALNEATFKGATLTNVSFRAPYAITNKYYRSIKTIHFDGAKMDKLTYATLKGLGADLSNVTTI